MENRKGRKWVFVTFILTGSLLFLLLLSRLAYLQIVRGEYYRGLASRNHIRVVVKPAPRGVITDRNGVVLADSRPAFIVSAVPSEFDSSRVEMVADLLGLSDSSLKEILNEASLVPHRPVVLRESMSVQDVSRIAETLYRIPGVMIDVAPMRRYSRPEEFSHIIGYVGLDDDPESYRGEITGRTGIERSMDDVLHGKPGLRREVVDAMGRIVEEYRGSETRLPSPGMNIVLTVDAQLQRVAFEELKKTGLAAAAVVMNWRTGEVLCATSFPGFDPNMFARGISSLEWNRLVENPGNPLYCRAWAASYPPASTFKIVTAYWLLAEDFIDENTMPGPCYGSYTLGDTEFGCWTAHGRLEVVDALARSCDIFFYRTSQLGSLDELAEYAGYFGLGSELAADLFEESSGLVPTSDYMNEKYGGDGWGNGTLLNVSIGQGELLATPLQMAAMTGIIASGGSMPHPHIVEGEAVYEPVFPRDKVDEHAFDVVIEGMLQTVESRRGTLRAAFQDFPYAFWGKTGTAECSGENHAVVVGFTREPVPLAICVYIEHGQHGGSVAGPVVRNILVEYFGAME